MSSPARNFANAANAQLSTGPRTEAGKAQSAQNARKHGLTAVDVLIPFEERAEFEALHAGYDNDIHPQGAPQQTLFEELAASAWNLRRIRAWKSNSTLQRHPTQNSSTMPKSRPNSIALADTKAASSAPSIAPCAS